MNKIITQNTPLIGNNPNSDPIPTLTVSSPSSITNLSGAAVEAALLTLQTCSTTSEIKNSQHNLKPNPVQAINDTPVHYNTANINEIASQENNVTEKCKPTKLFSSTGKHENSANTNDLQPNSVTQNSSLNHDNFGSIIENENGSTINSSQMTFENNSIHENINNNININTSLAQIPTNYNIAQLDIKTGAVAATGIEPVPDSASTSQNVIITETAEMAPVPDSAITSQNVIITETAEMAPVTNDMGPNRDNLLAVIFDAGLSELLVEAPPLTDARGNDPDHAEQSASPTAATGSDHVEDVAEPVNIITLSNSDDDNNDKNNSNGKRPSKEILIKQVVKDTIRKRMVAEKVPKYFPGKAEVKVKRLKFPIDQYQLDRLINEEAYTKLVNKHKNTPAIIRIFTDTFRASCLIKAHDPKCNTTQATIQKLANEINKGLLEMGPKPLKTSSTLLDNKTVLDIANNQKLASRLIRVSFPYEKFDAKYAYGLLKKTKKAPMRLLPLNDEAKIDLENIIGHTITIKALSQLIRDKKVEICQNYSQNSNKYMLEDKTVVELAEKIGFNTIYPNAKAFFGIIQYKVVYNPQGNKLGMIQTPRVTESPPPPTAYTRKHTRANNKSYTFNINQRLTNK